MSVLKLVGVVVGTLALGIAIVFGVNHFVWNIVYPATMGRPVVVATRTAHTVNLSNKLEIKEDIGSPIYEYLKNITVVIRGSKIKVDPETQEEYEVGWMGTGIIIQITATDTYILTNQHVAPKEVGTTIFVENTSQFDTVTAEVLANCTYADLSLIRVTGTLTAKAAYRGLATTLTIGERLFMVGHHLGRRFLYAEGIMAGWDEDSGVAQLPTLFGNSGSGVFDTDGMLVGVIYAGSVYPSGPFSVGFDVAHGLFVPLETVKAFLRGSMGINVD